MGMPDDANEAEKKLTEKAPEKKPPPLPAENDESTVVKIPPTVT